MKNADMPVSPMFNEHGCPQHHSSVLLQEGQVTGLTKRELFAAMAMQGMLSNPGGPVQANSMSGWNSTVNCTHGDVAHEAIKFADDLLSELEHTA